MSPKVKCPLRMLKGSSKTVVAEWIEVSSDGLCYEVPSSWFDDSEATTRTGGR